MWRNSALAALVGLLATAGAGGAVTCAGTRHAGQMFTICEVDAADDDLRLFLNDPATGRPLGSFANVEAMLGRPLIFAMNAGMYHPDRRPVGHYVEAGEELAPVVGRAGPGNFGMLPNGIFCVQKDRARVVETQRFLREVPACRFATQSGPMLVIDGTLHPRFLPDSDSRYIRNGVGTSDDGRRVWFAISEAPVTFHEFGTLFRDVLKVRQALYFDGNVSRLYAPEMGRHDGGFPMGPMVGVVAPAE